MAGSQTEIVAKSGRWTSAPLCRSHRLNELLQLIVRRGPAVEAFDHVEHVPRGRVEKMLLALSALGEVERGTSRYRPWRLRA